MTPPNDRPEEEKRIRAELHESLRESFVYLPAGKKISAEQIEALFPKQRRVAAFNQMRQMCHQNHVTKKIKELGDVPQTGS